MMMVSSVGISSTVDTIEANATYNVCLRKCLTWCPMLMYGVEVAVCSCIHSTICLLARLVCYGSHNPVVTAEWLSAHLSLSWIVILKLLWHIISKQCGNNMNSYAKHTAGKFFSIFLTHMHITHQWYSCSWQFSQGSVESWKNIEMHEIYVYHIHLEYGHSLVSLLYCMYIWV